MGVTNGHYKKDFGQFDKYCKKNLLFCKVFTKQWLFFKEKLIVAKVRFFFAGFIAVIS